MTEEKKMDNAEQLEKEELPEEKLDEVAGGMYFGSELIKGQSTEDEGNTRALR